MLTNELEPKIYGFGPEPKQKDSGDSDGDLTPDDKVHVYGIFLRNSVMNFFGLVKSIYKDIYLRKVHNKRNIKILELFKGQWAAIQDKNMPQSKSHEIQNNSKLTKHAISSKVHKVQS